MQPANSLNILQKVINLHCTATRQLQEKKMHDAEFSFTRLALALCINQY